MGKIKCYDTLSKEYVTVQVTDEIEEYVKRSYWRENMQERRFNMRKVMLNEQFSLDDVSWNDVTLDCIIKDIEIQTIYEVVMTSDERTRLIIYYRYYEGYTLTEIAKKLGISTSYMSKLMRKIHNQLRLSYEKRLGL